ncbi:hypothetical protein OSB04_017195 [Centaurea solstitialis]|uniref:DUF8040 domain-containing protein n=1 Tax=Centaurea solstitialis TaxID=347529 RepID=A0AA38TEC3_9ASTR|nr:hypothetical protein OSB04_017195 [Centaurea solstitialis]
MVFFKHQCYNGCHINKKHTNLSTNNPSPSLADCMNIVKKFSGFNEGSIEYSKSLLVFTKMQNREAFMFPTTDEAKMEMNSDDSDSYDDNEDYLEEDIKFKLLCRLAMNGILLACNICTPCHTSDRTEHMFINDILNGHPRRCYEMFRLHVPLFRQLCVDLVTNYGMKHTRKISIEESVGMFLMTLAHGAMNRFTQETFGRSGETVYRHFSIVLAAVMKMSADMIKSAANYDDDIPEYVLNNPRYYPMLKVLSYVIVTLMDCIGTIDGTHVKAVVPKHEEAKYIGRKGYATQNIMVVCDFNMCFTFRPKLNFPHPTVDKYYVVDDVYPNTKGYLAPYKDMNIRYHLPDFQRGHTTAMRAPRGPKEKFNYHHSSLLNNIEQTFGVES